MIGVKKRENNEIKVALVHDYLQWHGGAEKVLEVLHEIWPDAPVYTSVYNEEKMPEEYKSWDIRTSFMQRLPGWSRLLKHYSFLYPMAFEEFDFSEYDVVISSSAGFAKGIITKPETLHLGYTHTPPRFQWGYETETRAKLNSIYTKFILPPIDNYLRMWDQCAAKRVDHFIANSKEVQRRIRKFYRQESELVYPPVDVEKFLKCEMEKGDYFVTVARLERYKKIDIIISACNKLGLNLKVIGDGSDREYLEKLAGPTIEFLGRVDDKILVQTLCGAKAFVYMAEEDFGIVMVEALASGIPLIAYAKGGALEIVEDGKIGMLVNDQSVEGLQKVLRDFDGKVYNSDTCRESAKKFSKERFKREMKGFVLDKMKNLKS